ncbi:MAG: UvrD-helicase domain-containing protein [Oscillospiraceae bacterium]|nr:UvrD-helicase domain-containing protein [Oscillospiraceae bacterium]
MNQSYESRFLKARREWIASRFSQLNPPQLQGVMTTSGPVLLLAGAGSGKTTVLINRIANLIRYGEASDSSEIPAYIREEDVEFLESQLKSPSDDFSDRADAICALNPVPPWSIIAITFTNKAAGELKDRLESMLGSEAQDIWAMTFHSACCRILRREIDRLGYASSFTIYDTADSERVMKDVLVQLNLDEKSFAPRMLLNLISRFKDRLLSPEEAVAEARSTTDIRVQKAAEAYGPYQKMLQSANALDFDDIILLTVKLLQRFEDVRSYYQKRFRYVLIDEYQDTNHMQYLLASLLSGGYENICVVGDDDQSIYRFRGATIDNILNFEKQYKGAKVIRLEQNYRSTQSILNAANALIANNQGRKGKTLWTQNGKGEKIGLYEANSEQDEASYVARRIFQLSRTCSYKDIAILYRTNAQSNALERGLKQNGIPYRIIGGTRFFDRAEIKDMMAYLCVINNHADDLRLRRIINNPPRKLGEKTIDTVSQEAAFSGIPMYNVVSDPYSYHSLEKSAERLMAFTVLIEGLSDLLQTMPLPEFYDELLNRTGYLAMLEEKNYIENRTRAENVRELRSSIVNYCENTDTPSLSGFLEETALYTDIDQMDPEADAVVLMTVHSSKGLEFPHVILVGMEAELFPGNRSSESAEELEEERRLCYVAITRAKQSLTITCARNRLLYGRTMYNHPSRFISELPPECLTTQLKPRTPQYSSYEDDLDFDQTWRPSSYQTPRRETKPKTEPAKGGSSVFSGSGGTSSGKQVSFQKGEMVIHKSFGRGMVLSVLPMGNDALLEIAFDKTGTKKLMQKAASQFLKKEN